MVRFTRQARYGSVRLDSQLHLFLIHCDPLLLKKRKIDSHIKKLFCSASPTLAHVSNQANQTACEDTFLYALFFSLRGPRAFTFESPRIGSMELPELNETSAFLVRYELRMSEEVSSSRANSLCYCSEARLFTD